MRTFLTWLFIIAATAFGVIVLVGEAMETFRTGRTPPLTATLISLAVPAVIGWYSRGKAGGKAGDKDGGRGVVSDE